MARTKHNPVTPSGIRFDLLQPYVASKRSYPSFASFIKWHLNAPLGAAPGRRGEAAQAQGEVRDP